MKRATLMLAVLALLLGGVGQARADFQNVDFSSQANFTWAGADSPPGLPWSGVYLPGAPTGSVSLGGIPFDIKSNSSGYQAWNAYVAADGGAGQQSIAINTDIVGATNVYTLINTFWGQSGPNSYAALIFTGSGGASYTLNLIGNSDIRDWNQYIYTHSMNGTSTINVFSISSDIFGAPARLDMQDIVLPAAFAAQTLTSIELVDTGGYFFQRAILDGVTVEFTPATAVPEPSSIVLFGLGSLGLLGYGWRRRKQAVTCAF